MCRHPTFDGELLFDLLEVVCFFRIYRTARCVESHPEQVERMWWIRKSTTSVAREVNTLTLYRAKIFTHM